MENINPLRAGHYDPGQAWCAGNGARNLPTEIDNALRIFHHHVAVNRVARQRLLQTPVRMLHLPEQRSVSVVGMPGGAFLWTIDPMGWMVTLRSLRSKVT